MNMNIKLLLLDFGGVIAPEGFQLGILQLAMKYGIPFREMYRICSRTAGLESGYTAGKISEGEYWNIVARELGTDDDMSVYRDIFLDNFQPRHEMLKVVDGMREHMKTGIFSDQTNWIHELDDIYSFFRYFDYRCISFDVGFTKYDTEFYRIPSGDTGIEPENILLIDDKKRVIDMAESAGMNGYQFTSINKCRDFLISLVGQETLNTGSLS